MSANVKSLSASADLQTVTRFAPSPTGYLHLGHAYSALLSRQRGDRFILRIEDIDPTRCKPEFEAAIYEDLAWLGLTWEEPVLRQSDHLARYEAQLMEMHAQGLVYRCFKTRKDIEAALHAPHTAEAIYTGAPLPVDEERHLMEQGLPFAWRLSMAAALDIVGPHKGERHGDVVLGRKETPTSYHLSCVMDDAAQGITHVIRGEDLREIADLHDLLFRLLGHTPPVIEHHALMTDETGKRFAKRDQSVTLRALRAQGLTQADIRLRTGL